MTTTTRTIAAQQRQQGAAAIEAIIVSAVLIPLVLAGLQIALAYNAKSVLNYATFEAARAGAVQHGAAQPMKEALARHLLPLYGGGTDAQALAVSYAKTWADLKLPVSASSLSGAGLKLDILSPTKEAFDDFGFDASKGVRALPNSHLKYRDTSVGRTSGVSIQDANLLKIKVTYGYRLFVPLANKMIARTLTWADPANAAYYESDPPRLPIQATATVRMQSPAHFSDNQSFSNSGKSGSVPASKP
jgi:hypothetical protein